MHVYNVYCVLCGRMTLEQKRKARDLATLDTRKLSSLMKWLKTESGHPAYANYNELAEWPTPTIIEDKQNKHNTDKSVDEEKEMSYDGATFHFSSNAPDEDTGVFNSNEQFTLAMLKSSMPKLFVEGGNRVNPRDLLLENACVVQFPFGMGGPSMKRRNRVSGTECYRYYTRLSLNQFYRPDFLHVLNYLNNRARTFETAVTKCKFSRGDTPLPELIAQLDQQDFERAARRAEDGQLANNPEDQTLKIVTSTCQAVGSSTPSAAKNRKKFMAMDDLFGGTCLFVTITPCDFKSLRVQIMCSDGKIDGNREITIPDLIDPETASSVEAREVLSFNLNHRKELRMRYPGACSLVFQHIVEIIKDALLAWDPDIQLSRKDEGAFGPIEAWGAADEEQARKTLHIHWLLWVTGFNRCRRDLFSDDVDTRKLASMAFIKYVDRVTSATYPDFTVELNCPCKAVGKTEEVLEEVSPQELRDARHQDHCLKLKGEVVRCKTCRKPFSTREIVALGVDGWRKKLSDGYRKELTPDQLTPAWLDSVSCRHSYDSLYEIQEGDDRTDVSSAGDVPWLYCRDARSTLMHLNFDEHDCSHRSSCFKKGPECRFMSPTMWEERTTILFEDDPRYHCDMASIFGGAYSGQKKPFVVLPKRSIGSEYLNPHSRAISEVFSCNTSTSIGDKNHSFYVTMYSSKDTNSEDKQVFQRVVAALGRRVWYQIVAWREEGHTDEFTLQPDFGEGLGRILTGINAALSRDIVSSTMSHNLVYNNGSRFRFSHDFTHLLLCQVDSLLKNTAVDLIFRRTTVGNSGQDDIVKWADCMGHDYLHRPQELSGVCLYKFMMWYERHNWTTDNLKRRQEDPVKHANMHPGRLSFHPEHPGCNFIYLSRRKQFVIPIIYAPQGALCDLGELRWSDPEGTCDSVVTGKREEYAKAALMLFYPFDNMRDLLDSEGSYWGKFVQELKLYRQQEVGSKELEPVAKDIQQLPEVRDDLTCKLLEEPRRMWSRGFDILQNMQDRKTTEKVSFRARDRVSRGTVITESTGERKKQGVDEKEVDYDVDVSDFDCTEVDLDGMVDTTFLTMKDGDLRSHDPLIARGNINVDIVATPTVDESMAKSFFGSRDAPSDSANGTSDTASPTRTSSRTYQFATILSFVQGSVIGTVGGMDEESADADGHNERGTSIAGPESGVPTIRGFAESSGHKLDAKQYAAYKILCTTFLIDLVQKGSIGGSSHEGLASVLNNLSPGLAERRESVTSLLKKHGAMTQLVMLLTGPGGCGKSTCVSMAQGYCHAFCARIGVLFNDTSFAFTSTTGSSAAIFGGTTIHGFAYLNRQKITDNMKLTWKDVRVLVLDEVSFFKTTDMEKLDRNLRKLKSCDEPYGGLHVVFSGDFHQLQPVMAKEHELLYGHSDVARVWQNTVNCAIILEKTHRFSGDPEFGEIMARVRSNEHTEKDIDRLNERVIAQATEVESPSGEGVFHVSPNNNERFALQCAAFQKHLRCTHPTTDSNEDPPNHTIIVEAEFWHGKAKEKTPLSKSLTDFMKHRLTDNDIKVTSFCAQGAKLDAALRLFVGAMLMVFSNEDLKDKRANGTVCRVLEVLLKEGVQKRWKNWDGRKVWTVSVNDVEGIVCEHYPNPPPNTPRKFVLKPRTYTATVSVPFSREVKSSQLRIGNVKAKQFGVNTNFATTYHKMQGVTAEKLVVSSWNYSLKNGVYVVLSRVKKLTGLFLCKPLDKNKDFKVDEDLIAFEKRLHDLQDSILSGMELGDAPGNALHS
mmetsp:Transcript_1485/g.3204  ORF Transcript_1485/g.3204 Transcript_1485/m.3204 type:complete len:1761 (+) Transcript_1485:1415-6697(+)